jgi:hypothetical protein
VINCNHFFEIAHIPLGNFSKFLYFHPVKNNFS